MRPPGGRVMIAPKRKPRLIDDTGFLIQRVQEHERKPDAWLRSPAHLDWVRTNPCRYCGHRPGPFEIQACHLRKGTDGAGSEKPSDFWCWPGCPRCHGIQSIMSELAFHRDRGISDPWRMVLTEFGMRSPVEAVRIAATVEFDLRYGAAA